MEREWEFLENAPNFVKNATSYEIFKKDSVINLQGHTEEDIYILLSGTVSVYYLFADGSVYHVTQCQDIDVLGDVELFSGKSTLYMVSADTNCKVAILHKEIFLRWLKEDNSFCFEVLRRMALKQSDNDIFIKHKLRLPFYNHLALWLYESGRSVYTKKEIVERFATPIRSVNRGVKILQEKDVLKSEAGKVFPDYKKLEDYINESGIQDLM